jgi:hypothetical protein
MTHWTVWTDNCSAQYKCNQNFLKVARFASTVEGVTIVHRFAQKYHFKGVWDAAGKVVKKEMRDLELSRKGGARLPNALACFLVLRRRLGRGIKRRNDYDALEAARDAKVLEKGHFTVSSRIFGYVTEDREEFEKLSNEYYHIVYSDRVHVPQGTKVKQTLKLHQVSGSLYPNQNDSNKWKLHVSCMPCSCLSCRGVVADPCKFQHITKPRSYWVRERNDNSERTRQLQQQYEPLKERLQQLFGVNDVTKMVQDKLRLLGQPISGLKHIVGQRLLDFLDANPNPTVPPPLASDYVILDTELDDAEAEEEDAIEEAETACDD